MPRAACPRDTGRWPSPQQPRTPLPHHGAHPAGGSTSRHPGTPSLGEASVCRPGLDTPESALSCTRGFEATRRSRDGRAPCAPLPFANHSEFPGRSESQGYGQYSGQMLLIRPPFPRDSHKRKQGQYAEARARNSTAVLYLIVKIGSNLHACQQETDLHKLHINIRGGKIWPDGSSCEKEWGDLSG